MVGNVVTHGNPLMEAILNRGLPFYLRPAVAGRTGVARQNGCWRWPAHEQTTTTSMLAWILEDMPGWRRVPDQRHPQNFGLSARLPGAPRPGAGQQSPFFVIGSR